MAAAAGARILLWDDLDFPQSLRRIPDCPPVLYVQGCIDEAPAAAVVGSRRPSHYGRRIAFQLGRDLAARGAAVVSGLARGIDAEAHRGALATGGRTWAVLGSGLGAVYPPEHEPLGRDILESGGALLSEFPMRAGGQRHHFPLRNRIISGLAFSVVVVEGRRASGSRLTAEFALKQGKDVCAVPGPVDSPLSEATFDLLRDGARPVCSAEDVLNVLKEEERAVLKAAGPKPGPRPSLSLEHQIILKSIGSGSPTLDSMALDTGLRIPDLSHRLFEMELLGLVKPLPGGRYGKKDH